MGLEAGCRLLDLWPGRRHCLRAARVTALPERAGASETKGGPARRQVEATAGGLEPLRRGVGDSVVTQGLGRRPSPADWTRPARGRGEHGQQRTGRLPVAEAMTWSRLQGEPAMWSLAEGSVPLDDVWLVIAAVILRRCC